MTNPDVRSFAGLVSSLLDSWRKLGKFLLLMAAVCLILWVLVWGIWRVLPNTTSSQMSIGPGGILLAQTTGSGAVYIAVVDPQGWEETGIQVTEGDVLNFEAYGKVQPDLRDLNYSIEARRKATLRVIAQEQRLHRWEAEKENFRIEGAFTDEETKDSKLLWDWNDPNGNPETQSLTDPYPLKQVILKGCNIGALVGAIRETGVQPARSDAFFVGRNNRIVAKRSGKLYFIVNDVWDDDDTSFPDKFFVDNIGFFYVKVTVEHGR